VIGAGSTAAVAVRWRCELNENAEVPASAHELPEADHNDIVGWTGAGTEFGRLAAVFLDDSDLHPRLRERIALTEALIAPHVAETVVVASRGESCTERVMSLVLLGDLVSLYLAVLRGVDPTPVAAIERFKDALTRQ
jgi:glucose/mannose-6-phosphate isomerase